MVYLDPIMFYGLIALAMIPVFISLKMRIPDILMIGGAFLLAVFALTTGLIVDRPIIDIEVTGSGNSTEYSVVYDEIQVEFDPIVRGMLIIVGLIVILIGGLWRFK